MKSGRVPLHGKFWSEGQRGGGGGPWSEALIKAPLTWDPLWNRSLYRWLKTNGLRWVHFSIPLLFIEDLEGTVGLPSAWKSFRSQTQLTDCFFLITDIHSTHLLTAKMASWVIYLFVCDDLFILVGIRQVHQESTSCLESTSPDTVDGKKSGSHQLRLVVYPIIYKAFYIPGGCLGFHQQLMKVRPQKNLCELWLR